MYVMLPSKWPLVSARFEPNANPFIMHGFAVISTHFFGEYLLHVTNWGARLLCEEHHQRKLAYFLQSTQYYSDSLSSRTRRTKNIFKPVSPVQGCRAAATCGT